MSESFEPPLYLQPYGTILPSLRQRSGFRPTAQNTPHVCTYGTVVYVGPGGVAPGLEMSSMRFVPETRIKDIWWCSEQYHRHGRRVLGVSEYFEPPRVFAALWYHLSVLPAIAFRFSSDVTDYATRVLTLHRRRYGIFDSRTWDRNALIAICIETMKDYVWWTYRRRGRRVLRVSQSFKPPVSLERYGTIFPFFMPQRSGFCPTPQNTPRVRTYCTIVYVELGGPAPGLETSSWLFVSRP